MSTIETNQPAVSLDIHQSAPVFAVWTSSQNISLHSLYEGKVLNQIRYHEGLLGNRLGKFSLLIVSSYPITLYVSRASQLSEVPPQPGADGSRQH